MIKFKVSLFLAICCSSFDTIASVEQNKSNTALKNSNIVPAPHLNIPATSATSATSAASAISSQSQILPNAAPLQSENAIRTSEQASLSRKNSKETISTAAAAMVSESQNSPNKPAAYQEFRYSLWTFAGKSNTSYLIERDEDGSFATTLEQEPLRAKTLFTRSIDERFKKDLVDEHNQERLKTIIEIGKKYSKKINETEKALTSSQSQKIAASSLTLDEDLATVFRAQQEQALLTVLTQQKIELKQLRTERKAREDLAAFIYNEGVEKMKDRAAILSHNYGYFKTESKYAQSLTSKADKKDPYQTVQAFESLLDSLSEQKDK
jgi:hypothetical protein